MYFFSYSKSGHQAVVKWLINHGAKLSLDKFGKSPINDAAENQQTECLNVLVQHSSDYMMSKNKHHRSQTGTSKTERFHMNNRSFISKGSTSSDSEPFYLHPPTNNTISNAKQPFKEQFYSEKNYYGAMPNEGIFINPMRSNFNNPPSPSDSSESFFLHDPQEIIYNRVKDIFESDTSLKEESSSKNNNNNNHHHSHKSNAMTVQAEIHSSSSYTASGSDVDENHNKTSRHELEHFKTDDKRTRQNSTSNLHDYEDIYLVREEAKNTRKAYRSRDSGSHSRSRSSSSTRSQTIIVETNVS